MRVVTAPGLAATAQKLQFQQHLSIALEINIMSPGVADRFLVIKRERDQAKAEARHHQLEAAKLRGQNRTWSGLAGQLAPRSLHRTTCQATARFIPASMIAALSGAPK